MIDTVAFIDSVPLKRGGYLLQPPCLICHETHSRAISNSRRRRALINACAAPPSSDESPKSTFSAHGIDGYVTDEIDFDEDVVSDDTHVVIDSKDINLLIQQLQRSGEDDLSNLNNEVEDIQTDNLSYLKNANVPHSDDANGQRQSKSNSLTDSDEVQDPLSFDAEFFNAAELFSDAREGRPSTVGQPLKRGYPTSSSHLSTVDMFQSSNLTDNNSSSDNTTLFSSPSFSSSSTPLSSTVSTNQIPQPQREAEVKQQERDVQQTDGTERTPSYEPINFEPMNYFSNENREFMPSWVLEMYENNDHQKLELGSNDLSRGFGFQKLHDIAERRMDGAFDGMTGEDGIADCTIGDVADDYHVPIEFLVDALIAFGIQTPIKENQSIRGTLTTAEIQRLLLLFARHDSTTLAERYSDRCISELASDYDLDVHQILNVCQREGLYIHAGEETHLSLVREDRVLDIILNDEPMGKDYPPLLEGLEEQ